MVTAHRQGKTYGATRVFIELFVEDPAYSGVTL